VASVRGCSILNKITPEKFEKLSDQIVVRNHLDQSLSTFREASALCETVVRSVLLEVCLMAKTLHGNDTRTRIKMDEIMCVRL
jgi:hypothetical protein